MSEVNRPTGSLTSANHSVETAVPQDGRAHPAASEITPGTAHRNTPLDQIYARFESILMGRRIMNPEHAMGTAAGAIEALAETRGEGWSRPPVLNDFLARLIKGGWGRYSDLLLKAYSSYEHSRDPSKERLFYELKHAIQNRSHPLYRIAPMQYQELAAWLEYSMSEGEPVPGGLLDLQLQRADGSGRFIVFISDTHAHNEGLWSVLNMRLPSGETLLSAMYHDRADLIVGGDNWLPIGKNENPITAGIAAIDASLLLTDQLRGNFFWLAGNHDGIMGLVDFITGGERGEQIRRALARERGTDFLWSMQEAVDRLPVLARVYDRSEGVAAAGHTPVSPIRVDEATRAPFDPILRRQMTFGHLDQTYLKFNMTTARASLRIPNAVYLAGHVHPSSVISSVFRPFEGSKGIVIVQSFRPMISGVAISKESPARVTVISIAGGERTPLTNVDLRQEFIAPRDRGMPRVLPPDPASPSPAEGRTRTPGTRYGNGPYRYAMTMEASLMAYGSHIPVTGVAIPPIGHGLFSAMQAARIASIF